jgi:peptidoglycan/xylan/chitin deacetylase (PgdA/CDA1 family)
VLYEQGHTLANHTHSHPGLVALAETDGDVAGELTRTDALIRPFLRSDAVLFRAPYGNWRQIDPVTGRDRSVSIVAQQLSADARFANHLGPINWDITAEDFSFWERGASADEAAEAYLAEIEQVGRGIVLMHDSSDDAVMRRGNRTLELMQLLVPALRRRGYTFCPIEEIPGLRASISTSIRR